MIAERILPRVSEEAYARVALSDPDGQWELHDGHLVEKPGMSTEHNAVMSYLGHLLQSQLDWAAYRVKVNGSRTRRSATGSFIPDIVVIPTALERSRRGQPGALESYAEPLPFVAEVWSPSTGGYDVDTKLPEYLARGDREVWRLHPFERRVRAWRRQPDGTYAETDHGPTETVAVASLPSVAIDLVALFAE